MRVFSLRGLPRVLDGGHFDNAREGPLRLALEVFPFGAHAGTLRRGLPPHRHSTVLHQQHHGRQPGLGLYADRIRDGGLRPRALPVPGPEGHAPDVPGDPDDARGGADRPALHHLPDARPAQHALQPDDRLYRAEHPLLHAHDAGFLRRRPIGTRRGRHGGRMQPDGCDPARGRAAHPARPDRDLSVRFHRRME